MSHLFLGIGVTQAIFQLSGNMPDSYESWNSLDKIGASSGAHLLIRIDGMSSGPAAESDFNFLMFFFIIWGLKIILLMRLVWGV